MLGKTVSLMMDLIVVGALGWAIASMRQLSSHIKIIRDGKTELQQLLQQLNIHISNAQHALEGMKKAADDKGKQLERQVDNAAAVMEELQFIQKAADNVAQRLEKLTGQAAGTLKPDEKPSAVTAKPPAKMLSKAEKDLAEALAKRRSAAGE